eukprot:3009721-Pleurochrysis_carterae.AAC.2
MKLIAVVRVPAALLLVIYYKYREIVLDILPCGEEEASAARVLNSVECRAFGRIPHVHNLLNTRCSSRTNKQTRLMNIERYLPL